MLSQKPITPNQSSAPSSLPNNPVFAPFLNLDGQDKIDFSTVPGDTTLGSQLDGTEYPTQNAHNDLAALRISFPFLQIIPFPPKCKSILLTHNVSADINLPDGTVAILLKGNGDYYVSTTGAADIPTGTTDLTEGHSIYKPEGYLFYVGGKRSLSIIAPVDNTVVSILCFPATPIRPR